MQNLKIRSLVVRKHYIIINYSKGSQKARRQLPPLPHASYAPELSQIMPTTNGFSAYTHVCMTINKNCKTVKRGLTETNCDYEECASSLAKNSS